MELDENRVIQIAGDVCDEKLDKFQKDVCGEKHNSMIHSLSELNRKIEKIDGRLWSLVVAAFFQVITVAATLMIVILRSSK